MENMTTMTTVTTLTTVAMDMMAGMTAEMGENNSSMEYTTTTEYYNCSNSTMTMEKEEESDDSGAIYFEILIILATYFYPLVIIGGVLFNGLSLAVLFTAQFRKVSIGVYLSALAVTDSLVLLLDFINNYFKEVLGLYVIGVNGFLCSLYRFSFDVFFTLAAWLVVAITLERFIVVWFPLKVKTFTSVRKAKVVVVILFVTIVFYKMYNFWAWKVVDEKCDWSEGWEFFHTKVNMPLTFAAYSYIPLLILICLNSGIIYKLWQSQKLRNRMSSTAGEEVNTQSAEMMRLTVTVLIISFAYMILTVPLSAYYTIQYADNQFIEMTPQMAMGEMIILIVGLSNHSINFFLYIVSSKNFRSALIRLFTFSKFTSGNSSSRSKKRHVSSIRKGGNSNSNGCSQADSKSNLSSGNTKSTTNLNSASTSSSSVDKAGISSNETISSVASTSAYTTRISEVITPGDVCVSMPVIPEKSGSKGDSGNSSESPDASETATTNDMSLSMPNIAEKSSIEE